jgi:hypothetical protein
MSALRSRLQSNGLLAVALGAAVLLSGCANPSGLRLEQPGLSGPQQRLELVSEQVYWTGDGPVYRLLAEVPLPGAGTGRAAYLLYLRVTSNSDTKGGTSGPVEVRGFLIQTRGTQAGLTPLVEAGVVEERPGEKTWKLRVDLVFEDSSRLTGHLIARRADWKLTRFETRSHTADVQALLNGPLPKLRPLP